MATFDFNGEGGNGQGILYMLKISEMLLIKEITPEEVSQILNDATEINRAVKEHIKKIEEHGLEI